MINWNKWIDKLKFRDREERLEYRQLAAKKNYGRMFLIICITLFFVIYLLIKGEIIAGINAQLGKMLGLFSWLSFAMIVFVLVCMCLYRSNQKKYYLLFNYATLIYCSAHLLNSVIENYIYYMTFKGYIVTLFFISVTLINCFFFIGVVFPNVMIIGGLGVLHFLMKLYSNPDKLLVPPL